MLSGLSPVDVTSIRYGRWEVKGCKRKTHAWMVLDKATEKILDVTTKYRKLHPGTWDGRN